ncbi:MAG: oligopeptide/dipeptide ABC transporter ATP-binding protein [Bacillota bacterium]
MAGDILQVRQLVKYFRSGGFFHSRKTPLTRAVDGIDFTVARGEAFGLVGESGCGKTTTGRILLGLLKPTAGEVLLDGRDITMLRGRRKREIYRDIQGVFQDPLSSMNPRMTIGEIVTEPLAIQGQLPEALGRRRTQELRLPARELLARVGLPESAAGRYPHQCSGGQRQRAALARALAANPGFIVLDEPLSALDISCQAQMINLLQDCQKVYGLGYLLISHDLLAVRYLCNRVAVMYRGKILETGAAEKVFAEPAHPYTCILLAAVPTIGDKVKNPPAAGIGECRGFDMAAAAAEFTGAVNLTGAANARGCRFRARCPEAAAVCAETEPALKETAPGHAVACHMR